MPTPNRRSTRAAARGGATRTRARGRVTPKAQKPIAGGRYTPPIPREVKVSPPWVPWTMGAFLLIGMVIILANYMSVMPGVLFIKEAPDNAWLLIGLGFITGGFITATRWR